jgi:hypothetical protein
MTQYETDADWQAGRDRMSELLATIHGPVVGTFIVQEVAQNGPDPVKVREAWRSVLLPVRERYAPQVEEVVKVLAADGFNALVEVNTEKSVLQYWIDTLDGVADDYTTFAFEPGDGEYLKLPKAQAE